MKLLPILDTRRLILTIDALGECPGRRKSPAIVPDELKEKIRQRAAQAKRVNLRELGREFNLSRETIARALGRRKKNR